MYPVRFKKHRPNTFNLLLDDFFTNSWNDISGLSARSGGSSSHTPAVNISEDGQAFKLELSAPGFPKDAFKVNLEKNLLSIEGSISSKTEDKTESDSDKTSAEADNKVKWTRREFRQSSFKRSFKLPNTVDAEKIDASYEQGILTLVLPKKTEAVDKPARFIDIK